uniref:Uncharacterized protein n=1 Tax=Angiostrongylus cantonensis TaxID=6313 RepID=A0A0K0D552_ANGCA
LISRFQVVSMTPPPSARDGLVQFSRPSAPTPLVEHLQESSTQRPFAATSLAQSPLTGFPTLIPFEPNIDSIPNIDKPTSRSQSTSVPVLHSTVIKSIHHRIRTTPDPRIIQPPESLVIIGESDEEPTTTDNWHQPMASSSSPSSGLVNALIFPQLANTSGGVSLPNSFISEEISDSKLHSRGDSSGWTTQRCFPVLNFDNYYGQMRVYRRFCALVMNPRRCRTRARLFTPRSNGLDRRKTFVATAVLLPPSPLPAPLHHQRLLRHKLSRFVRM